MSTRTASRSTTGGEIGAALAISKQENPPAADAAVNAAEDFKKSRRLKSIISASLTTRVQECASQAKNDQCAPFCLGQMKNTSIRDHPPLLRCMSQLLADIVAKVF
jgi:hypothetical protein